MDENAPPMKFDDFLKDAVREYYDRHGKRHPADFAALLIAVGGIKTASIAWDSLKEGELPKKMAFGAVGLVALRYGLRYVLSGPLGLIATGLSVVTLAKYVVRHRPEIGPRARVFGKLIEETQEKYERVVEGFSSGRLTQGEHEMIIEGLRSRLIRSLLNPVSEEETSP